MNATVIRLNNDFLEKVTGGGGFDMNDMTPEEYAHYEELEKRFYQACEDYSNHLIDTATFIAIHNKLNAFYDEMERKYG